MSVSETVRGIVQESVESMALASGINGSNLQPRCRICRNDSLRTKVNDLLTTGASYAMVLRALGDDNAKLEQRDRVTIHSIRNHTARHYREILERRAKENGVDFLEGVITAITPIAFFETMVNSFLPPDPKPRSRTRTLAARRLAEARGCTVRDTRRRSLSTRLASMPPPRLGRLHWCPHRQHAEPMPGVRPLPR
jgi:hypothetical protein